MTFTGSSTPSSTSSPRSSTSTVTTSTSTTSKRASEAELIDIHNVLAVADNAWWERNDIDPAESPWFRKELLNLRARSDAKRIFDAEQAEADEQLERLRRRLVADSDVDDLPEPGWVIDRVIPANGLASRRATEGRQDTRHHGPGDACRYRYPMGAQRPPQLGRRFDRHPRPRRLRDG